MTLADQILAAFAAKKVALADVPESDPMAQIGKKCEGLFTAGVETLRSTIPNDRIRSLARVIWDLVGHKRVLVGFGPDVPSLTFTAQRQASGMIQGFVVIPKRWPQMVDDDPLLQLGAILFVGAQVVDFCNDRLFNDPNAEARAKAYEAELLLTLARTLPKWKPNSYQQQILVCYPKGLDSVGVELYPYKPYEESRGTA